MTGRSRAYLDHNATAPVKAEVAEAMARALLMPGNASSVHSEGRAARAAVEQARAEVAALVGARPQNVVFTGSGTEANATVLSPALMACDGGRDCRPQRASLLLHSATEHASVRDGHRFAAERAEAIPVDGDGVVVLDWLDERLARAEGPVLVSVHAANNETGALQPLEALAALVRRHGALLHADAVQAAGKVPLSIEALGVDVMTVSAHKLGGPQGVGAIAMRSGALELAEKLVRGGGQERGWRAGTENVAGIVGFGRAAVLARDGLEREAERLRGLRDRLEAGLAGLDGRLMVFAAGAPRLPNTSAFALPETSAETLLIKLDLKGFAVSSGSACSSGKVRRSHVLDAMGVPEALSRGALRLSLGWTTCGDEIDAFVEAYADAAGLRGREGAAA